MIAKILNQFMFKIFFSKSIFVLIYLSKKALAYFLQLIVRESTRTARCESFSLAHLKIRNGCLFNRILLATKC